MFMEPITIGDSVNAKVASKTKTTTGAVTNRTHGVKEGSGEADINQDTDTTLDDHDYLMEEISSMDDLEAVGQADAKVIQAENRILGDILNIHV